MARNEEVTITHSETFAEVRDDWLQLEQVCNASLYRSYRWATTWFQHLGKADSGSQRLHIVVLHLDEQPIALFPFTIARRFGVKILSWLGDSHFNDQGGLFSPAFFGAADVDSFGVLWERITTCLPRWDVAWFGNQVDARGESAPTQWLQRQPSGNSDHYLEFEHHDWSRLLKEMRSRKTRKRMRNEENQLKRAGEIRFANAETDAETEDWLRILLQQRSERFKLLGIGVESNLATYERFYLDLLQQSLRNSDEDERYYLMGLFLDEEALAMGLIGEKYGVAYPLLASMTTSDYSRWSPGDFLWRHLIEQSCERKLVGIDFGLGEDSTYKAAWCNRRREVFDTIHAQSTVGKLVAGLIQSRTLAKQRIKQSDHIWNAYRRLRKAKSKIVAHGVAAKQQ